jgi:hypothetical protein
MFQLLVIFLFIPVGSLLLVVLGRLLFFTARYQIAIRKLPPSVPRQKTMFPILQQLNEFGGYEKYLSENQDENGTPIQIMNQGPQLDGSLMICFSSKYKEDSACISIIEDPDVCREILRDTKSWKKHSGVYEPYREFLGNGLLVQDVIIISCI